ncbi:MAG: PQQ-like beta-propeller repeat protein [Holosporales bacterium]|nr:PQQ-like beta-propeller repeat protein [Holosporales bacterium]
MKKIILLSCIVSASLLITACEHKEVLTGKREEFLTNTEKNRINQGVAQASVNLTSPSSIKSCVDVAGNKEHNSINYALSQNPKLVWKKKEANPATDVICHKDRLYFVNNNGALHCLDAKTGEEIWNKSFDNKISFFGGITIHDNNIIVATNTGNVVGIDLTNHKETFSFNVEIPIKGSPVVSSGNVVVTTVDNRTVAFSISGKKKIWERIGDPEEFIMDKTGTPAVLSNGNIIAPYTNGDVLSLDIKDGNEIWMDTLFSENTSESGFIISHIVASPLVYKNCVLVATSESKIAMIDAYSGIRVWEQSFGTMNSPVIDNGWIFLLTSNKTLVCIRENDGEIKWEVPVTITESEDNKKEEKGRAKKITKHGKAPTKFVGPLLINGYVQVFSKDGDVVTYNPKDGKKLSVSRSESSFNRTPIIVDKTMYVVNSKSEIVCLR